MRPPYPLDIVPLIPEFLNRRRSRFAYPLRAMDELGLDRPAYFFVVGGVALQGEDGAHLVDILNPYPTVFDANLAAASAAREVGLVEEVGGRWRATARGREVASRFRRECDAYLATLEPIPAAEVRRLADLLERALGAIAASDLPKDHLVRLARFRGDARIPMVALDNAMYGLWQARDDCHMSSWREAGFSGPVFDVLTRVWRSEATTEGELAAKLPQQRPADVTDALTRLRSEGLVSRDGLAVTERGAAMRAAVEDATDRRFFAPWPDDVGREAPWLVERLRKANAELAPAP